MKKFVIAAGCIAIGLGLVSCGAHGDDPGRSYMPDMYYSRAFETYYYNDVHGEYDSLKKRGIFYNRLPVPGTIARGDAPAWPLPNSNAGHEMAVTYISPYDTGTLNKEQRTEAERIYLINCAICHGTALGGNGPLWNGGNGPFPAAPRNLKDEYTKKLSNSMMYHVITYGMGAMGSYASQVKPEQRWWIIKYIREKQEPAGGKAADSATAKTATPVTADSTKTK